MHACGGEVYMVYGIPDIKNLHFNPKLTYMYIHDVCMYMSCTYMYMYVHVQISCKSESAFCFDRRLVAASGFNRQASQDDTRLVRVRIRSHAEVKPREAWREDDDVTSVRLHLLSWYGCQ